MSAVKKEHMQHGPFSRVSVPLALGALTRLELLRLSQACIDEAERRDQLQAKEGQA